MFPTNSNLLPLIVAEEKDAMLASIANLLRQYGFVVMLEEQAPSFGSSDQEIRHLDALSILRFVNENWNKEIPVVIFSQACETVPAMKLAA